MRAETISTRTQTEAWAQMMARLPKFTSAVLTGLDAHGYPYSVRCYPQPDRATRTLRMPVASGALLQSGPAGLLCHRHDERLWNQRSFLVRGALTREGAEWRFEPRQYVQGMGYDGALGLARFVVGARRATDSYLAKRGLPRPSIPWDEVIVAKRQAQVLSQRASRSVIPALAAALALSVVGATCLLLALRLARRAQRRERSSNRRRAQ